MPRGHTEPFSQSICFVVVVVDTVNANANGGVSDAMKTSRKVRTTNDDVAAAKSAMATKRRTRTQMANDERRANDDEQQTNDERRRKEQNVYFCRIRVITRFVCVITCLTM